MKTTVEVKCAWRGCRDTFTARVADRKRGWAKFCSKSCKAKEQESRTGQNARHNEIRNYFAWHRFTDGDVHDRISGIRYEPLEDIGQSVGEEIDEGACDANGIPI